jgi:hypothetical protein
MQIVLVEGNFLDHCNMGRNESMPETAEWFKHLTGVPVL